MAPVVLIIGCGIAGPVLGILLKRKGYEPIVFDKVPKLGDAGASLLMAPNGMKVLQLAGVADKVIAESTPITTYSDASATGRVLGTSNLPASFEDKYHQPLVGIKRTTINMILKKTLHDLDVSVREGWELQFIKEDGDSVTAFFNKNRSFAGSFLIGCDGIKSATRGALLRMNEVKEEAPSYTGLTQTAGISKAPKAFSSPQALRNWYGNGIHAIAYPISKTHISWAITQRESTETTETWRPYSKEELSPQKGQLCDLLKGWCPDVQHMVERSEKIIKFGLFDRVELSPSQWHSKRCVLVGDAAHPTSPHLGQGANQALEDCYHLSHSLPYLIPADSQHDSSLKVLGPHLSETVFEPFAKKRQARTSTLVRAARAQGEQRTAAGDQACHIRDSLIVNKFANGVLLAANLDNLFLEPF